MLKLVYFASIREQLGCEEEQLDMEAGSLQVKDLMTRLSARGAPWDQVLGDAKVLVAVNQEMGRAETELSDGDEIAFFPPVTGG
ncbi:molybdopterin converting factor subunit 1 [Motiliproteus sp. MSK22-1]|uniref:molybdopterin converting factor subunit 1 n=1 Tax=Motiliproteus sp. MSK22-1 TaxID=1897630 RepID=UPI0009773C85|nr:molybdopterin converting factor subunit 1 [Motiliproteus sp. MSK22-1]OMH28417.1 molybdopterin converting factor subunit 1 [Motiliproteus sp. MSK22-1]